VYREILSKLHEGYEVLIVGHSYGGAIASKMAELFNVAESSIRPRVHIVTLGSIYIPKTKLIKDVDLVHYMHVYDISLRCNSLEKKVNHNNKHIIWIKSLEGQSKSPHGIFAAAKEWQYHKSYGRIMSILFRDKELVIPSEILKHINIKVVNYEQDFFSPKSVSILSPTRGDVASTESCVGPSCLTGMLKNPNPNLQHGQPSRSRVTKVIPMNF
jgi:hypothetical protein